MKTMQMREFLRGGYKRIDEMTLITNHGRPVATWMPQSHMRERELKHLSYVADLGVDLNEAHTPSTGR